MAKAFKLMENDVILFDGDSITDCGRDRADASSLSGYNRIIQDTLNAYRPTMKIKCYNRGVSGNTSKMLRERIDKEISEVKPTVISLLIGINDVWRRFDNNTITTAADFEQNLRAIIKSATSRCDRVILLEPFLLHCAFSKEGWRADLDPKINIVRALVREFNLSFIPLDGIFGENGNIVGDETLTADGVHPTNIGNALIAAEFLKRYL